MFFFLEGSRAPKTTKSEQLLACQRNAIEISFHWIMAHIECWFGSFVIFRGSGLVLLGNPINFYFFRGGPDPLPTPSRSAHVSCSVKLKANVEKILTADCFSRQNLNYISYCSHGNKYIFHEINSIFGLFMEP